jgi:hypothetical protein
MSLTCWADIRDMSATDKNVCRLGGGADRHKSRHCQPSAGEQPLMIPIRLTNKAKLCFFCGDASNEGFGGATQYPDGTLTSHEGLWDLQFADGGSNLQEAQNQVNHRFSTKLELGSMMDVNCGVQLIIQFGQQFGIKECQRLGICFTWFSP